MRVIVLIGIPDSGKSTTLNLLYNMLVPGLAQSHNNRLVLGNPVQNDFSETVTFHNETVEFFTMGDYPKKMEIAIRNAANRNSTIFICSCSRFSAVLRSAFQQYRTTFINKTIAVNISQQNIFNAADAQTIFNLI